MMKRLNRKLAAKCAGRGGYSLMELVAALVVLSLMAGIVTTGVTTGVRAYERSMFTSQAEMLSATINTALADPFRFMEEGDGSFTVVYDGQKITFDKHDNPLVLSEGRLYFRNTPEKVKVVNEGVYGDCKLSSLAMERCSMDGVEYSYEIESTGDLTRSFSFAVKPLQDVERDRFAQSAEGRDSGGEGEGLDVEALNDAIGQAELALEETLRSDAATAALEAALENARTARANAKAQRDIDSAEQNLRAALMAYLNSDTDSGLSRDRLEQAMASARAAQPWSSNDTAAVSALQAAYSAAESALVEATEQSRLDSAAQALESALAAYLATKDDPGPSGPDGPDEPDEPGEYDVTKDPDAPAPNSGPTAQQVSYSTEMQNANPWNIENSFKWKLNSDGDAAIMACDAYNQYYLVYYRGVYYTCTKYENGAWVDTSTILSGNFKVSDLTDGESHDYGWGARMWRANS